MAMIEENRKALQADLYPRLKAELKILGDKLSFWRVVAVCGWLFFGGSFFGGALWTSFLAWVFWLFSSR